MEVWGIAGQDNDAAGRICFNFVAVKPVAQADVEELLECTVVPHDAERAVVGADQSHGRLHDPAQDDLQVQVGDDGAIGREQCP